MPCVFTALCNCACNKCAAALKVSALKLFSLSFSLYVFICGVSHQVMWPYPAFHCVCMWACLVSAPAIRDCTWSCVYDCSQNICRLVFALECVCLPWNPWILLEWMKRGVSFTSSDRKLGSLAGMCLASCLTGLTGFTGLMVSLLYGCTCKVWHVLHDCM